MDGAKIARTCWNKDRSVYLVYRCFADGDDPRHKIDKYENDVCVEKDWKPSTEDLFADDWKVLRGV